MTDPAPARPLDDHATAIMNRWLGNDVDRGEPRQALHRVVETLRVVASELVRVDAEGSTLEDLLAVEDLADRLRHAVTDLERTPTTPAAAPVPISYLTERSPVTGASNPAAYPLRLRFGDTTVAHAVYTEQHEGPAGGVHGGVMAASFDEVLGIAQMATGSAGYTGTLEVRYLAVTPLHTVVTIEAGVDRREGRKLRMWARSTADGEVTAEATGIFVVRESFDLPEPA